MIRILDLDNCIADDEWRISHIDWQQQDPDKRYEVYHGLSINDQLCNAHLLDTNHDIFILTARPERFRKTTMDWLERNNVKYLKLLMRPDGNHMHSTALKQDQLKWLISTYNLTTGAFADAYDDREDVVKMYCDQGINAHVVSIHSTDAYSPPSTKSKSVPEILLDAAQTYDERNRTYGDSYKRFGDVMTAMFPNGITLKTVDDWNRMGIFIQATSKFVRYSSQFENGGHKDSAHDLINYAAMLEEMTK